MYFDKSINSEIKKATKFLSDTISKLIKKFLKVRDVLLDKKCFNQRPAKFCLEEKTY